MAGLNVAQPQGATTDPPSEIAMKPLEKRCYLRRASALSSCCREDERTYCYSPLQHADEIRLLIIEPGERSIAVQCAITHFRLSDYPQYEALSYTWGSEETPENIECGEQESVSITRNCFEAIRQLRQVDRPRTVWIDAVCINQTSLIERGHQVEIMPHIYQQAATVIVYLGESEDDSDVAMEYLGTYAWIRDPPTKSPPHSKSQLALERLLSRAWFNRIWVLQEVFMARSAVVLCGNKSILWDCFRRFAKWTLQDFFGEFPRVLSVGNYRTVLSFSSEDFFKLLCDTRNCCCTDPRDRVFALLSMGSEAFRRTLTVDYIASAEVTFTNVAVYLIGSIGLDTLCGVDRSGESSNLPSWVPDWRIPARVTPMIDMMDFKHSARGPSSNECVEILSSPAAPQKAFIRPRGHRLPSIDILGEIMTPTQKSWDDIIRNAWSCICTPSGPNVEEFFRILYMDARQANSWVNGISTTGLEKERFVEQNEFLSEEGILNSPRQSYKNKKLNIGFPSNSWAAKLASEQKAEDELKAGLESLELDTFPYAKRKRLYSCCVGRRIFRAGGFVGLAPAQTQRGDIIYILRGARCPFIFRQELDHFILIGACFAAGAMNDDHPRYATEEIEIW